MEELIIEAQDGKANVDLLCDGDEANGYTFGVRLRPWSNTTTAGRMVLGQGDTVQGAIECAVQKAREGRWERLDWAKRPWTVKRTSSGW